MKIKTNFSKLNADMYRKLPYSIRSWLVFVGLIICLTTLHLSVAETPEAEPKDAEVTLETEQTPQDVTDDSSTVDTNSANSANSASDKETPGVKKEFITGTSDEMERNEKDGVTVLIGNAKTKRLDENEKEIGFLNADRITIKSDPETRETTEIIAVGNVEIRDEDIFATCDHATMNNITSIITLKENVVVLQNKDRLETKLFTFNRLTGKQTGVGGVKFSVEVTQTTPSPTSEDTEETSTDEKESSETPTTDESKKDSKESVNESEKDAEESSEKSEGESKATSPDSENEKKESDSKEKNETSETGATESEETEAEDSEEADSEDDSEGAAPEEE